MGFIQRPLSVAAAVVAASVSADLPIKIKHSKPTDDNITSETINSVPLDLELSSESSWVSSISASKLAGFSFVAKIQVPVPNISTYNSLPNLGANFSVASSSAFVNLYHTANLARASKPKTYSYASRSIPFENLYIWHLPEPSRNDVSKSVCSSSKTRTVVVLLGWLGAKQKHLNTYAKWYTSRGFHAITFTFPMSEILNYQVGGKAEQDIELFVNHLAGWLEEEHGRNIVFHTFSNTGWLTYGVILEKFQKQDPSLLDDIKGCIVDSAPVAAPDPQVWASGFSAAFLKKQSIATKGGTSLDESAKEGSVVTKTLKELKPTVTETALLVVLEKFFEVVLNLPAVNRRLSDVFRTLSSRQPRCPQLYMYSSADRIIPASAVESFMKQQQRSGYNVRSCNFVSTPHVDHFRNDPELYTSQLTQFLENFVLPCCKGSL